MNTNKKIYNVLAILLAIILVAISATNVFATEPNANDVNDTNEVNNTNTVNDTNTNELDTNLKTDSEAEPTEITFTDFSKATYTILKNNTLYTLKVDNVTLDTDNSQYIAFLTSGDEEVNFQYSTAGYLEPAKTSDTYFNINRAETDMTLDYTEVMIYNKDIYLTIVEYRFNGTPEGTATRDKHKVVVNKQKLTRPKQNALTQRLTAYFSYDYTSLFNWEVSSGKTFKYHIEIGRVTDNNILKGIKNGEANALANLLAYAKKTTPVYKTSITTSSSKQTDTIFDEFDVVQEAYYYSYIYIETENGTYYPIEDIMLYIGKSYTDTNDQYREFLYNYLDKNFSWNIQESEPETGTNDITVNPTQNTVKNDTPTSVTGNLDNTKASGSIPQTGNLDWITIGILAVIGTAFGVGYYKSKKYSDIK